MVARLFFAGSAVVRPFSDGSCVMHGLDFGYWTARIAIPVLSLGRFRVQSTNEQLPARGVGHHVVEKDAAAVFGAFVFAALVSGAAMLILER
jgi:hypothetical protein